MQPIAPGAVAYTFAAKIASACISVTKLPKRKVNSKRLFTLGALKGRQNSVSVNQIFAGGVDLPNPFCFIPKYATASYINMTCTK